MYSDYRETVYHSEYPELDASFFGGVVFFKSDEYEPDKQPQIYLPHQCDEWEIGGPEDARKLAADLLAAADAFDEYTKKKEIR